MFNNQQEIYTKVGVFKDNVFTSIDGKQYNCITYGIIKRSITGKIIVANFRYSQATDLWVLFQYLELNEDVV